MVTVSHFALSINLYVSENCQNLLLVNGFLLKKKCDRDKNVPMETESGPPWKAAPTDQTLPSFPRRPSFSVSPPAAEWPPAPSASLLTLWPLTAARPSGTPGTE